MMDAVLVLDGKIPYQDFGSRQPFYVYVIAAYFKLFGTTYTVGRLLPLTCSMLIGVVMFLLAKRLFGMAEGTLACAIYWMLPIEIYNSVVVKTEPLVVLLTCLSFYLVIRATQTLTRSWMIVAGICAAAGFYVRESALIIPSTVLIYLLLNYRKRIGEIIKNYSLFLAGYVGSVSVVYILYSKFVTLAEFINSPLSPSRTPLSIIKKLLVRSAFDGDSMPTDFAQSSDRYYYYFEYVKQSLNLHSFLVIGALILSGIIVYHLIASQYKERQREYAVSCSLMYVWVLSLLASYAAYYTTRGFFIDYAREFLPPLVILFSAAIRYVAPSMDREEIKNRVIWIGGSIGTALFFIASYTPEYYYRPVYAGLTIGLISLITYSKAFESTTRRLVFIFSMVGLMGLIVVSRQEWLKPYISGMLVSAIIITTMYGLTWKLLEKTTRTKFKDYLRFVGLSLVGGAFVLSAGYSGSLLDLKYDSPWPPRSVEAAALYLQAHTNENDKVMSGAVIWELESRRRPFMMISHPLGFEHSISENKKEAIQKEVEEKPPRVIILDGYTEKTYIKSVPVISKIIEGKYELMTIIESASYFPIKIYRIKDDPSVIS